VFVVAHGAWSAGWAWKKMHPILRARGHSLITPTYTGLGERSHLARPDIDLDTHITDICQVLEFEDLKSIILIGHSYGGMIATGVADCARARIAKLVYLDAFAPRDGESVFDLLPPESAAQRRPAAGGDNWRIPPGPMPPDTPEADRAWCDPRRTPQPLKTFQPAHHQSERARRSADRHRQTAYRTAGLTPRRIAPAFRACTLRGHSDAALSSRRRHSRFVTDSARRDE
jgi:pimeloyl-ACP methyl ester carboxylesterase